MFTLLILFVFPCYLVSQAKLAVGEVSTVPGEKKSGYIIVPGGEDDGPVKVPVTVINGKNEPMVMIGRI